MKRELKANDVFIFISYDGGTTYSKVICLTSNGISRSTSVIESSTKCGVTSVPGAITRSISGEGVVFLDPDANETSLVDFIDLFDNGTEFFFKMGVAFPGEGDYTTMGEGYFSALDETYAVDASATFSFTITPTGALTTTLATS